MQAQIVFYPVSAVWDAQRDLVWALGGACTNVVILAAINTETLTVEAVKVCGTHSKRVGGGRDCGTP